MAYITTVQLLLDVGSEAEAADAVGEILREQQRHFTPSSCLLDYRLHASDDMAAIYRVILPYGFQADDEWPEPGTWLEPPRD